MLEKPRAPLRKSSRIATRKKAQSQEYAVDPNATTRLASAGRHLAGPGPAPVPASALLEVNKPDWTAGPGVSQGEYSEGKDVDRPMPSISSVTEKTGSKAWFRSPTTRMTDLKFAEKPVSLKVATLPADVSDDVRKLSKEIKSLVRVPRGVIPLGIEI
jgi:hypothetical protein